MLVIHRIALFAVALALAFAPYVSADEPPAPPIKEKMMVWVEAFLGGPSALKTEMVVNGKSIGVFDSNTQRDISDLIKMGSNTISFTTTPQEPASMAGEVEFQIGPVTTNPKTKKTIMKPVLFRYKNSYDWKLDGDTGKFTHPFGPNPKTPDKKSVTHSYTIDYAGVAAELAEPKEGGYSLQSDTFLGNNASVNSTVSVNGKPLGSFMGGRRSLNVSPLLKAGENEIRLTTEAIANQLHYSDTTFEIIGPLSYSPARSEYLGRKVLKFQALEGWTQDRNSGVVHVKGNPGKTTHERVIRFTLEDAPK